MSGHQKLDRKEIEENNLTPTQSQVSLILLANFVVERVNYRLAQNFQTIDPCAFTVARRKYQFRN